MGNVGGVCSLFMPCSRCIYHDSYSDRTGTAWCGIPSWTRLFQRNCNRNYRRQYFGGMYDSIVGGISVGKKIQVSTNNISSERVPNLKLGDNIRILYIGNVSENEKELLILENTISIFLLDENGEVIIEDVN